MATVLLQRQWSNRWLVTNQCPKLKVQTHRNSTRPQCLLLRAARPLTGGNVAVASLLVCVYVCVWFLCDSSYCIDQAGLELVMNVVQSSWEVMDLSSKLLKGGNFKHAAPYRPWNRCLKLKALHRQVTEGKALRLSEWAWWERCWGKGERSRWQEV